MYRFLCKYCIILHQGLGHLGSLASVGVPGTHPFQQQIARDDCMCTHPIGFVSVVSPNKFTIAGRQCYGVRSYFCHLLSRNSYSRCATSLSLFHHMKMTLNDLAFPVNGSYCIQGQDQGEAGVESSDSLSGLAEWLRW